jgi:hypothetical protein
MKTQNNTHKKKLMNFLIVKLINNLAEKKF